MTIPCNGLPRYKMSIFVAMVALLWLSLSPCLVSQCCSSSGYASRPWSIFLHRDWTDFPRRPTRLVGQTSPREDLLPVLGVLDTSTPFKYIFSLLWSWRHQLDWSEGLKLFYFWRTAEGGYVMTSGELFYFLRKSLWAVLRLRMMRSVRWSRE